MDYYFIQWVIPLLAEMRGVPLQKIGLSLPLLSVVLGVAALGALLLFLTWVVPYRLIRPATLTVLTDGVVSRAGRQVIRYDWQTMANARVGSFPKGGQLIWFDNLSTGKSVAFGGTWNEDNSVIADEINKARAKWVARHPQDIVAP
jgi:hypothetical protein